MMLRPTATKVVPTSDYQLIVTFDNGEKRRFDVKPYIKGKLVWQSEGSGVLQRSVRQRLYRGVAGRAGFVPG